MSWTRDLTKEQKRELRRLRSLAHDRELSTALSALEEQFRRWRSGEFGPQDLNGAIHAFHQGPSRELWARYSTGDEFVAVMVAVRTGILAAHEVPSDLLESMKLNPSADG